MKQKFLELKNLIHKYREEFECPETAFNSFL